MNNQRRFLMKLVLNWIELIFTLPLITYRLLRYGYTFRKIYLGEGKYTLVDAKDYFWLKEYKWILSGNGASFYAVTSKLAGPKKTKLISMHRMIMNQPKSRLVDHRNCDSLDNRRQNLRLATDSQNQHNKKKTSSKCSSKYKGVRLLKDKHRNKPWQVSIQVKKKRIYLGYYSTEIEAAKAYDNAAKKYYGDFAHLNFPERSENSRGWLHWFSAGDPDTNCKK